jgi:hypothetical protein
MMCLISTSQNTTTPTTSSISTSQKITTEVMHHFVLSFHCLFRLFTVLIIVFFSTVLDLNLPLDEFGAVDFNYVQNLAGKFFVTITFILVKPWLLC